MKVSVIFTTYNNPEWLQKVLWGFFEQTHKEFEIVIADDGSTDETRELIEDMRKESPMEIQHIWQEDDGFQKCRIMNKAILAAKGDYLIFTDGDCIPRNDFVAQHIRQSDYNTYLSGGYHKLPMDISKAITRQDIIDQKPFDAQWLVDRGMKKTHKFWKLTAKGWVAGLLNRLSPSTKTWNGHNSSCYKDHALAVHGFEEKMQYGGQDCEFGYRLVNYGLKTKRVRYTCVCVHLDHSRGYVTPEMVAHSDFMKKDTRKNKVIKARLGLEQYLGKNNAKQ